MITNEQYLSTKYGKKLIEIIEDDDDCCVYVLDINGIIIVQKLVLSDEDKKEYLRISRKLKLERVKDV